ncbi:MAG: LPS O-antigen chain length determinant protein WzzB [Gammaproteobacteria bacterium]|nr:LPS O-antigen chain length determinant protein WzzB [Gammaproteobacteria bacterium]
MAAYENRVSHDEHNREYYEDEISLTDLILVVWRHRWLAVITSLFVVFLTVLYLFLARPVYRAEAYTLPPLEQDIAELNSAKRFGLLGYDTKQVFDEFIVLAKSRELRRKFFDDKGLFEYFSGDPKNSIAELVFENRFNDKLIISVPAKGNNPVTVVAFENGSADKAALIVNEFIDYASSQAGLRLIANVNSDIHAKIQELSTKIKGKRDVALQRRNDEIAKLNEALSIARKLGISKPLDYNQNYVNDNNSERLSVVTTMQPLYSRGSQALEAEIGVLTNRKSDDPYINELRDLQETLSSLQEISIKLERVKVVQVDQAALIPYAPVKPKKMLVLAIGVFIGGFAGLFAVFVRVFLENIRKQLQNSN